MNRTIVRLLTLVIANMDKKSKHVERLLKQSKTQAGIDREEYFNSHGELARWRGMKLIARNKTKYTRKAKHKGKLA